MGRQAVGSDISSLAVFLSRVKTYPLGIRMRAEVKKWAEASANFTLRERLHLPPVEWRQMGYQKHLTCSKTWPIRKSIELLLERVSCLSHPCLQDFARCAVLRTGQWALDGRKELPTAGQFRVKFRDIVNEMLVGMLEYETARTQSDAKVNVPICLHQSADKLHSDKDLRQFWPPKLVLTSPPYPGVHVLYHRWQISGRRETPAPFWIANQFDGKGESHYTMGGRLRNDDAVYFESLRESFRSIREICDEKTVIAQVVGFSDPSTQFAQYISTLSETGYEEMVPIQAEQSKPSRVWRNVPSRRWYTSNVENTSSDKEVLLFHKISKQQPTTKSIVRPPTPVH